MCHKLSFQYLTDCRKAAFTPSEANVCKVRTAAIHALRLLHVAANVCFGEAAP